MLGDSSETYELRELVAGQKYFASDFVSQPLRVGHPPPRLYAKRLWFRECIRHGIRPGHPFVLPPVKIVPVQSRLVYFRGRSLEERSYLQRGGENNSRLRFFLQVLFSRSRLPRGPCTQAPSRLSGWLPIERPLPICRADRAS